MVGLGPFVVLRPLSSNSTELKLHWLYLKWEDDNWLMKSVLVKDEDQEPPAEDALSLQTAVAPQKLQILFASNGPLYSSLDSYGFFLEPGQIHAYQRNEAGDIEHAWSYQVEGVTTAAHQHPSDITESLLAQANMQVEDLPSIDRITANHHRIEWPLLNWKQKAEERSLLSSFKRVLNFTFSINAKISDYAALNTNVSDLQLAQHNAAFEYAARVYFSGNKGGLSVYLQRLLNLINVLKKIAYMSENTTADSDTVWATMTIEQIKTAILTYKYDLKNQLTQLALCCNSMSAARAKVLINHFSTDELLSMIGKCITQSKSWDDPNYNVGLVIAHLSQENFEAFVNAMCSQQWDLFGAYTDKKQALIKLLRALYPEQQRFLLQHPRIKENISTLALTGYNTINSFIQASQFDSETETAFLALIPPESLSMINSLEDCVARLTTLTAEEQDTFFGQFTDEEIQAWCKQPATFKSLFAAIKSEAQQLRVILGFLKREDLDYYVLHSFFKSIDVEVKVVLLKNAEIVALLQRHFSTSFSLFNNFKGLFVDIKTPDLLEKFGFENVAPWIKNEGDLHSIISDYTGNNPSPADLKKIQTLLLQNLTHFAALVTNVNTVSILISNILDSDASEQGIHQYLTQLVDNTPPKFDFAAWCVSDQFLTQFKSDDQKIFFLKIRRVYESVDVGTLMEMLRKSAQKEFLFNVFYPDRIKTLLLNNKAKGLNQFFYLYPNYEKKCRALFSTAEELNDYPSLQKQFFPEYQPPQKAPSERDSSLEYSTLCEGLTQAINAARVHLDSLKCTKPYVYLDIAEDILKQVKLVVTQSAEKEKPYALMNQVLSRCQTSIYTPTDKDNLTQLKKLSKQLSGQPTRSFQALGALLYSFAGVLIIAGLLAAIPLTGGNVLMSLCLAAKCNALAAVVSYSTWTALVGIGGGAVIGALTYSQGFFGQHGLAKRVDEFSKKVEGTEPPKKPSP